MNCPVQFYYNPLLLRTYVRRSSRLNRIVVIGMCAILLVKSSLLQNVIGAKHHIRTMYDFAFIIDYKNHLHEIKHEQPMKQNPSAFQYFYTYVGMTLAIDFIDGRSLSNKARCELLPKKSKVMLC